ncbi:Egl nine homolog [Seminavis robusta]|uniref:Egl nine homolog n=1 Tax=Seminavis robusta TaxID=568900 RepID=A0A9N8EXL2_9STRA|nr:Egl nine homolog [Seminavis robusta]|eukprot:Sro2080_g313700.1 Egl nine homolog (322) ;mRNA; f:1846-2811
MRSLPPPLRHCLGSLSFRSPKIAQPVVWSSRQASPVAMRTRQRFVLGQSSRKLSSTVTPSVDPILDMTFLDERLEDLQPSNIAKQLMEEGYFTTEKFLDPIETTALRMQSIALRQEGRFEQSWSESIGSDGVAQRFDKEGVFACEPDGADYVTAPDILIYMSWLLQTLPPRLNNEMQELLPDGGSVDLSNQAFNAKLAVTQPGGSTYPLHIDNPQGLAVNDIRKLTAIIYLNPNYQAGDGGELRIYLQDNVIRDLPPVGGRLLMFWSDEIPHEVLPTSPNADPQDEEKDRYALTVWIPTDSATQIHSPTSKFSDLKDVVAF